jgi:hypothetical protein
MISSSLARHACMPGCCGVWASGANVDADAMPIRSLSIAKALQRLNEDASPVATQTARVLQKMLAAKKREEREREQQQEEAVAS